MSTRPATLLLLLAACAPVPAPPQSPDADPRSTERPGVRPPAFPPSGLSDAELPITTNAYGAFAGAPHAPRLGDIAPDFEAPLVDGGTFSLSEARRAGPVLVMFYRGFW